MINTKRHPVGWFEIYVQDIDRARRFYESTFQVELLPLQSPEPNIEMLAFPPLMAPELPGCGGAICKMDGCPPGGGGTLIYFSCEDCALEEARAADAGGRIIKRKFSIGDYGFISLVTDSEGNTIGLHSME